MLHSGVTKISATRTISRQFERQTQSLRHDNPTSLSLNSQKFSTPSPRILTEQSSVQKIPVNGSPFSHLSSMAPSSPLRNSETLYFSAMPAPHPTSQKSVMGVMQHSTLHMGSPARKAALSSSATMKFGTNWAHYVPKHSPTQQYATNHSSTLVAQLLSQVTTR